MGKDSKKIILNLLNNWRSIIACQTEALTSGDLDRFAQLNRESVSIQAQLDEHLSKRSAVRNDREVLDSLQELHALHSSVVDAFIVGTKEISETIGMLRKNKTSLKGYKQHKVSAPRFMSERT
ncbi:MAG TPA: hypothetical protein PLU81_09560 [Deltaproteobacteria bacterium]|nr:hypothetical protein [Deltaproteobacteria bacterium]HPR52022.1 hypothetical protein [Deltaproteobacteria bacterium]